MKNTLLLPLFILCLFQISYSQTPQWQWATTYGGSTQDETGSVATDNAGNVYACGIFYSPTLSFGTNILTNTSASHSDIFLVKTTPAGVALWAASGEGTLNEYATSMAVDSFGNIYVTGYFTSPMMIFDTDTIFNAGTSNEDFFLVKYDSAGSVLWARSGGGTSRDIAWGVAVDASGNAYVSGYFQSATLNFSVDTLANAGGSDIFLVRYDSSGSVRWATGAGNADTDISFATATDPFGNIYLAGYYQSSILVIGSSTLINQGVYDIFLAKYDSTGTPLWARGAGGVNSDIPHTVCTDADGNAYMAGRFGSPSFNFGTLPVTTVGGSDIFLVKYDTAGNPVWVKTAGTIYADEALSVNVRDNRVYLAGVFSGASISFDSWPLTNLGALTTNEPFVASYDTSGTTLWAISIPGVEDDYATGVATDAVGDLYVTGYFNSTSIAFGGTNLNNSLVPYNDIFIAKLATFVGLPESALIETSLKIFPNPVSKNEDVIHVSLLNQQEEQVTIYNLLGECMGKWNVTAKDGEASIPFNRLSGVYIVEVQSGDEIHIGRLVKE